MDGTERTYYASEAFVSRDSLSMVAFAAFERLCEVNGRLPHLSLEIQLVHTALRDH
jgi:hypothetical protein